MECLGLCIFASVYLACLVAAAITDHEMVVIFMILIPLCIAEGYVEMNKDKK